MKIKVAEWGTPKKIKKKNYLNQQLSNWGSSLQGVRKSLNLLKITSFWSVFSLKFDLRVGIGFQFLLGVNQGGYNLERVREHQKVENR